MTFYKKIQTLAFLCFSVSLLAQEAGEDWYHKDPSEGLNGVSIEKTYEQLLKGRSSTPVVVAIIDSGIDIEHEDLKDNIWVNKDEIPDNGIDDDNNGYIDDVHGWNFIGGKDGKNVGPDTYEATRIYGSLKYKYEDAKREQLNKDQQKEYDLYQEVKKVVDEKRASAEKNLKQIDDLETTIMSGLDALGKVTGDNVLADMNLDSLTSDDPNFGIGMQVIKQYSMQNADLGTIEEVKSEIKEALQGDKKRFEDQLAYAYNPDFDTRTIVGEDRDNKKEVGYGNNDVEGPDALHGTHVGGIVGAVRNNDIGMNGVAENVLLMSVRAVPDGDERDKDVANAIRYAVDNGASIINMSFGKGYSPDKEIVDEAVRYAAKNDVLLVHAAGNSALNTDIENNFPNDAYEKKTGFFLWRWLKKKGKAKNWIEVGALNYKQGENLSAPFSNYAKENVDIFAPGMKIYATVPNDQYRYLQGTSMASPVVAGIAAVLRSYFPTLTAEQTKEIILNSGVLMDDMVLIPGGDGKKAKFSELSVTGKVANLYNAVKMAMNTKGKKKIKVSGNRA